VEVQLNEQSYNNGALQFKNMAALLNVHTTNTLQKLANISSLSNYEPLVMLFVRVNKLLATSSFSLIIENTSFVSSRLD
jgi:hypothetical protein